MFRRRNKRGLGARIVAFIWPSMGWRRTGSYYAIRIKRLPGTPYSIACGFALGAAVSFTPFIGFHFVIAAIGAYILRGNIIASAIGTAIGNPWTFPFIWAGIYWLGGNILGYERGVELPNELTMDYIFHDPTDVLLPMAMGGLPTAIVVWWLVYLPVHRMVANYQSHRRQRRLHRRAALARRRGVERGADNDAGAPARHESHLHLDMDVAVVTEGEGAGEGGKGVGKAADGLSRTVEGKG